MAIIKNKLKQRITIELEGGKSIGLLAEGKAKIADAALDSAMVKRLIHRGEIVVLAAGPEQTGREKEMHEHQERKGRK